MAVEQRELDPKIRRELLVEEAVEIINGHLDTLHDFSLNARPEYVVPACEEINAQLAFLAKTLQGTNPQILFEFNVDSLLDVGQLRLRGVVNRFERKEDEYGDTYYAVTVGLPLDPDKVKAETVVKTARHPTTGEVITVPILNFGADGRASLDHEEPVEYASGRSLVYHGLITTHFDFEEVKNFRVEYQDK